MPIEIQGVMGSAAAHDSPSSSTNLTAPRDQWAQLQHDKRQAERLPDALAASANGAGLLLNNSYRPRHPLV
eukprot:8138880-Pyramimonas_sp.AAC.1